MQFADQLKRLRVASETGHLPRDLAVWLVQTLGQLAPDSARREARDALLREAAALVGGSSWAQAHRLAREILAHQRQRRSESGIAGLVRAALDLDPECPASPRQLMRILATGDTQPVAMSLDHAGGW